jgi:hypothetical protein
MLFYHISLPTIFFLFSPKVLHLYLRQIYFLFIPIYRIASDNKRFWYYTHFLIYSQWNWSLTKFVLTSLSEKNKIDYNYSDFITPNSSPIPVLPLNEVYIPGIYNRSRSYLLSSNILDIILRLPWHYITSISVTHHFI